ncbi:MAG: TRAP transporter small permease [Synechococcaceae cyanobacterium SM2_3_60]|nr:TRAP transporter small permease [Synechococcaceae cyanobacterium SM2_3_60]
MTTVAVIATVFARYVLNNSFSWGEELPALLLVSLTFIGSAWLARYDQHLAFDGLLVVLPRRLQQFLRVFNLVVIEIFLGCMAYFGWAVVRATGSTSLVTLNFPMAVFRSVLPLGSVLMMLGYGVQLVALVTTGQALTTNAVSDAPVEEAERILAGLAAAQSDDAPTE